MPTEKCNFRCTYCYEDFAMGRMSASVVAGVKALLATRAPTLDNLYLSWFGGEPLLALDIVEDVQRHVQALCREHPGIRVDTNMTTNAWRLGTAVFARLLALGVDDYQITFDGPPEHHDKRVKANGKPTFERLWKNVVAMRDREEKLNIRLRLHVDQENLEAMFPFIAAATRLATIPGSVYRLEAALALRRAERRGRAAVDQRGRLASLRRGLKLAARALAPAVPSLPIPADADGAQPPPSPIRRDADGASAGPAPGHGEICYASRGNHFVVRSDGRLCKCTIVLDHPKNQVGRLNADGTVEISGAAMQPDARAVVGERRRAPVPDDGAGAAVQREERPGKSAAGVRGAVEPKKARSRCASR